MKPLRRELVASGTYLVDPLVLDLGAPNDGVEWDLRRLTVMDQVHPEKVYLNVVTIVLTPKGSGTPGVINPIEVADATPFGLPAPGTWSRGTIVLSPGERVQAWIYAGTPAGLVGGEELIATGQVEEGPYP